MTTSRYDAIVIGAGANGLAAAVALGKRFKRVLVLERADEIGGMARTFEIAPGFRAPLGPDGGWIAPATARSLGLRSLEVVAPKTGLAVTTSDGWLSIPTDVSAARRKLNDRSTRDGEHWPAFVERLRRLSNFLGAMYESPAPDVATTSLADLASLVGLGRRFRALGRSDMTELLRVLPMSVDDFLAEELEDPSIRAAIAAGGVRDLRQGPRSGGTAFNLLHYLVGAPPGSVRARSWWRASPMAMIDGLEASARRQRVEIRTGATVARINVEDDIVRSVTLTNGDEIETRLVVSTADPYMTFRTLADPAWLDPEFLHAVGNIKFRGTSATIMYALDELPTVNGLDADDWMSVISLSPTTDSIERAYDAVKYREASDRPHVELTAVSLRWPQLAPEGTAVVIARAQYTPSDAIDDGSFAERVSRAIEEVMPGFANRVLHRRTFMPSDLERELGVTAGALTHGELTLDQILFMRPVAGWGRFATPIDGLYLGGTGANPGPGLPGAAGTMAVKAAK
jgi:phytoene dehydrogenase-like protein